MNLLPLLLAVVVTLLVALVWAARDARSGMPRSRGRLVWFLAPVLGSVVTVVLNAIIWGFGGGGLGGGFELWALLLLPPALFTSALALLTVSVRRAVPTGGAPASVTTATSPLPNGAGTASSS